jgi:hypothetical protein
VGDNASNRALHVKSVGERVAQDRSGSKWACVVSGVYAVLTCCWTEAKLPNESKYFELRPVNPQSLMV